MPNADKGNCMFKIFQKIGQSRWAVPAVLPSLILFNWVSSVIHYRFDLTEDKKFTISEPTKRILKSIDSPIRVTVLLKGDYPSGFRNLCQSSEYLLSEFRELAGKEFNYEIISPDEKIPGTPTTYADSLTSLGFMPINLTSQVKEGQQQQLVFPIAVIHHDNRMAPVYLYKGKTPFINFQELSGAESLLEYHFAEGIRMLTDTSRQVVGYAMGSGEPTPSEYRVFDLFQNLLTANYETYTLNLVSQPVIPAVFDVLLLVKPTLPFSDMVKLKLDQYVMNGGKLLVFIDRLNAEMDSLQVKNQVVAFDRELGIHDLLFKYGVRVNPDLIMDLQCDYLPFDVSGNGQFEFLPWNYFPRFESDYRHPINKDLGYVSGRFANSMDTTESAEIKKTVLLRTSDRTRTLASPAIISGSENVFLPDDEKYRKKNLPVAILLEGRFGSFYRNRLSSDLSDSLEKAGVSFKASCNRENKMIVVSDGDVPLNALANGNEPIPMGHNQFTLDSRLHFPYANRDFVKNCLDYLLDESGITGLKNKDFTIRLLDAKRKKDEKIFWQVFNLLMPVLMIILFGFILQWRRRAGYSKKM